MIVIEKRLLESGQKVEREGSGMVQCATIVKFLAWLVNRTPGVAPQFKDWNRIVQFSLSGEEPFYVTFADGRMKFSLGEAHKPDLEFVSKSKDFFDVMVGKTKFDQGFSQGTYTIRGSITDAVKLMRVSELTFDSHPNLNKLMKIVSRILA
jgi:putative sterol carrier protein